MYKHTVIQRHSQSRHTNTHTHTHLYKYIYIYIYIYICIFIYIDTDRQIDRYIEKRESGIQSDKEQGVNLYTEKETESEKENVREERDK